MTSGLDPVVQHAPRFSNAEAERLARDLFGVTGDAEPLPSERDQNFQVRDGAGRLFVLKIANATERPDLLECQNEAMARGHERCPHLAVPRVVPARDGNSTSRVPGHGGQHHFVRLVTWVPGRPLALVRPHDPELLRQAGRSLADLDAALDGFVHPALKREFAWDLTRASWVRPHLARFDDGRTALLERVLERYEAVVLPSLPALPAVAIHNDWNDYNVMVERGASAEAGVAIGIVDFGDMLAGPRVADLATLVAYAMLGKPDPLAAAGWVVGGYRERVSLAEEELALVFDLARTRLLLSAVIAVRQREAAGGNEYLGISQQGVWALLSQLDAVSPEWATGVLRHACGVPASPAGPELAGWLTGHGAAAAAPVLDRPLAQMRTVPIDLGIGSLTLTDLRVTDDLPAFCRWIEARIAEAGAEVGIGRYDEARAVCTSDSFAAPGHDGPEPRTIHLGVDLFAPAGTPIRAPLEGAVVRADDNAGALDDGPTIILRHETGDGLPFYTLYGHLSRESLQRWREGDTVPRGAEVGRVGEPAVNGGWPPHLHLQVMTSLLGRPRDVPGVARPAQRDIWTSFCPDPSPLLGLPPGAATAPRTSIASLLERRRRVVGPSLSVSYRSPLAIARGFMQHLFDVDGRRYLDAVNNVPHVGHGHPRVVEAAARQLAVLNTNTRYLHETMLDYGERLASLMPAPLSVCYFVNSGSEANELALRLAAAFTGGSDIVVVDGAYHGNTTTLVDISPYKCEGPGGRGRPPHVHKVDMPDVYRGRFRGRGEAAAESYAHAVRESIGAIAAPGRRLSAFIAESLLSCGGQIVLPPGYLQAAYEAVRAVGGVCVADEVQVGLGRVGSHVWAFETQGVVPDIVTLGKPIGNGFPLGAVITRPDIARAFANGMEYFNTFGGNPASCAVGLAVLDVLRDEALQARAAETGAYFEAGLRDLQREFPLVGDVRGLGLFLGIELVDDRETRGPAARQASYVANRMRDKGVLFSTDGPDHNVLKIKPPMVFGRADADVVVSRLREILLEDLAAPAGRS